MPALSVVSLAALGAWLAVLLFPTRPWRLQPITEDEPQPDELQAWPSVAVLVPARNEAEYLPRTLPPLLAQDYPGDWRVIVVDDRSTDGIREIARSVTRPARVEIVEGARLPEGWVGKVWALEQAARRAAANAPSYYLLTDADIRHSASSLRRLVAESEGGGLALNSRMARLHCRSAAERLLIPPFLLFFNLLYPMRLVNRPGSRFAAAAGGCVLVRREALEGAGGFAAIRDRVIDDVSLARAVKRTGGRLRLSLSRSGVESLRAHDLSGVWRMVTRTAFTELRASWLLLACALAVIALMFPLPPALVATGVALAASGAVSPTEALLLVALPGALAWAIATGIYLPTVRYFCLRAWWSLALPLAGVLYGGMTLDSALRSRGDRLRW